MQSPKLIYHGKRVDLLTVETTDSRGQTVLREVVVHSGAVVILALLDDKILFIRNERFAVEKTLLELPAGTLEPNEEPLLCAGRELEEETGYRAAKIEPLLSFYSSPGFCNEILHAFLATDLTYVGQNLDPGETITVEPLTFAEALAKMRSGELMDAKTLATLFCYSEKYCV